MVSVRINSHLATWEAVMFTCQILRINAFGENDTVQQRCILKLQVVAQFMNQPSECMKRGLHGDSQNVTNIDGYDHILITMGFFPFLFVKAAFFKILSTFNLFFFFFFLHQNSLFGMGNVSRALNEISKITTVFPFHAWN